MDRDAPTPAEFRRALAECMTLADIDDAMGWLPGTAGRRRWRVPAGLPPADAQLGGVALWFRTTIARWREQAPPDEPGAGVAPPAGIRPGVPAGDVAPSGEHAPSPEPAPLQVTVAEEGPVGDAEEVALDAGRVGDVALPDELADEEELAEEELAADEESAGAAAEEEAAADDAVLEEEADAVLEEEPAGDGAAPGEPAAEEEPARDDASSEEPAPAEEEATDAGPTGEDASSDESAPDEEEPAPDEEEPAPDEEEPAPDEAPAAAATTDTQPAPGPPAPPADLPPGTEPDGPTVTSGFELAIGEPVYAFVHRAWRPAVVHSRGRSTVGVDYRLGRGSLDERRQRVSIDRVRRIARG